MTKGMIAVRHQRTAVEEIVSRSIIDNRLKTCEGGSMTEQEWADRGQPFEEGDHHEFTIDVNLANSTQVLIEDQDEQLALAIKIQIDNGVPVLHIGSGTTQYQLNVAAVDGQLLISTPENIEFETAPVTRHVSNGMLSLITQLKED
ncbi:hypothetical protein [Neptuniibacter sp. QD37_11]|uniref:hypothetical protein n=1 Tax=Neptuniibacter sp. QD37_11 TaxID=3398209 RepID=UPI0039F5B00E